MSMSRGREELLKIYNEKDLAEKAVAQEIIGE